MARAQAGAARHLKTPSPPQDRASVRGEELTGMKLYAAQEILAEVFGISIPEAEEMIRDRSREKMLWPERFSLED